MVFCEMFWIPFEFLVREALLWLIQVVLIRIAPFSQHAGNPSGIVVGKYVTLVVLAPLFYYGGLKILILIGKAKHSLTEHKKEDNLQRL